MNLLYTLALTSVYIFNSLGLYLSVGEDGKPAISDKPVAMDVTAANETPSKDANRWNFGGKDIKWILKSSADGTYTLGYQDSNAYSTAFVYTLDGAIAIHTRSQLRLLSLHSGRFLQRLLSSRQ